jgi:hypothetical protein
MIKVIGYIRVKEVYWLFRFRARVGLIVMTKLSEYRP